LWLETFFHEISHGLVAILTGGNLDQISLKKSGEGQCHYVGGLQWLVISAGYLGALFSGMFIYLGALASPKKAHQFGVGIAVFVLISGILWAKDSDTWVILIAINLMLFLSLLFVQRKPIQVFVQFIGVFVWVNAVKSLLQLLAIPDSGDHVELAKITSYPKQVWLIIWLVTAASVFWYQWKKSSNKSS